MKTPQGRAENDRVPTPRERGVLRRLAAEIAGLAQHPREAEKERLWRALNGLRPERPMLYIHHVPWGEFEDGLPELRCESAHPGCRAIETEMRRRLFAARRLPGDAMVDGTWRVPMAIEGLSADYGVPQVNEARIGIAQAFTPVIRDEKDIEKIRMPEVWHDADETARRLAFAENLFGDILPVRACGVREHFFKGWDHLVRRTGVQNALADMALRPGFIHALIGRMTDVALARMDQLEAAGLLDAPHPCPWLPPGPAGPCDELPRPDADPPRYRTLDQWGGASPQIFGEVSPGMHVEFGLRYENRVMARCGLNYYGCCEPLHHKMDILAEVPRLRKVSISPWCNVAKAATAARRIYVFSHKPSPAVFARERFDLVEAEADLRRRLRDSGPMPCQFTMKDISTVGGDIRRLISWAEMARRFVNEARPGR